MSLQPKSYTVIRRKRTSDGAGGYDVAEITLPDQITATLNRKRTTSSEMRLEQANHNTQGAGIETAYRRILCVRGQNATLQINDILEADCGERYVVHDIRQYDWTTQYDIEKVG